MIYAIPAYELAEMLERAAEAGANRVLVATGIIKPRMSQREAVRRYGYGCINQWRKDGKIIPVKEGGTIFYPTEKLEILTKTNKHERGTGKNRAACVAKRQPDGGGASGHNKSRRGDETA